MAQSQPASAVGADAAYWTGLAMAELPMQMGYTIAREGMRFWARRLQAYAAFAEAYAECKTPADVMQAQATFLAKAQDDNAADMQTAAETVDDAAHAMANGLERGAAPDA